MKPSNDIGFTHLVFVFKSTYDKSQFLSRTENRNFKLNAIGYFNEVQSFSKINHLVVHLTRNLIQLMCDVFVNNLDRN